MIQCIVCASIQDDNLQALASGLSPAQTQKHAITFLILYFLQYEILDLTYLSLVSFL